MSVQGVQGRCNSKPPNFRYCLVCRLKEGPMFAFPKKPEVREQWKQLCGLPNLPKRAELCYRHFRVEDIKKGKRRSLLISQETLPSLLLNPATNGHSHLAKEPMCVVPVCRKKKQDGVTLRLWPRLEVRRQQWARLCNLGRVPKRDTLICSAHFVPSDFFESDTKLTSKATPSQNLPSQVNCESMDDRENIEPVDLVGRTEEQGQEDIPAPISHEDTSAPISQQDASAPIGQEDRLEPDTSQEQENLPECTCSNESDNTDEGLSLEDLLNSKTDEEVKGTLSVFQRLSSSLISEISDVVNSSVSSAPDTSSVTDEAIGGVKSAGTQTEARKLNLFDLLHNDTQLKSFTRVSFRTLNILLKLVLEISDEKCEVTMKNRILLTLCKLRLNLSYECLAVLVGFDRRRCGEYFASTFHLLSLVLRHTIYWPSKEEVAMNMPLCFRNYRDTRIILDCTEVPVITPNCLRCKVRLYSRYKGGQTVVKCEVLVGVAPSGLITFLSKLYGGKASDKQIFEESDIVKNNLLEPFVDAVMVDKGFRIDKVCDERGIKMHRPPFIVKKQALTPANAKRNAEIANARVHVERIMQRLKIFQILQSKLSWSMVPFLDDIFIVIAGLVNVGLPILAEERFMTFKNV